MAKTLRSRIAAVAVIALGAGLFQAAPASAAANGVSTALTAYAPIARVDSQAMIAIKSSFTDFDTADSFFLAARIAVGGKPTGSALANSGFTADDARSSDYDTSANGDVATTVKVHEFHATADNKTSAYFRLFFTPDVAGTYTFLVWNDVNEDGVFSASEKSVSVSVTTKGAPTKITLTNVGGDSIADESYGALLKVTMTDSAGAATTLAEGEMITLSSNETSSDFGTYGRNGNMSWTGTDSITLVAADFTRSGVALVNAWTDEVRTVVITATGAGDLSASLSQTISVVFRENYDKADDEILGYGDEHEDGFYYDGDNIVVSTAAATTKFKVHVSAAPDAKSYELVQVEDNQGASTGTGLDAASNGGLNVTGGYSYFYDKAVTILADASTGTFSLTYSALGSVGTYGAAFNLTNKTDDTDINGEASAAYKAYLPSATTLTAVGGTTTFTATLLDQFGSALPDEALMMVVSGATGRNYGVGTVTKLTDADGQATFTLKDLGVTKTYFTDTVTFYTTGDDTALQGSLSITYTSITTGTLKVDASTALNAIDTTDGDFGTADASSPTVELTFTALDANSSPVVGLPIAVAATSAGAYVAYGSTTVYTDASGKAYANVYATKTGAATFTGTASIISATATATRTFVNAAGDAKKVVVAVSGSSATATVTDNFGNPVKGVTVDFARTGTATMNGGAASASVKTNANGVAEVTVSGNGTVTATLAEADYPMAYWIAGYNGKLATDTANAKAIAGVATGSASVAVTAEIDAVKATVSSLSTTITGIQTAISTLVASTTATLTAMSSQIAKIMKKLGIK